MLLIFQFLYFLSLSLECSAIETLTMMSETNHPYEAWEERYISEEKGKRVVDYYLASTSARSLLAVVGIEKSRRHMHYSVSKEFLQAFGSNTSVNASTRWTARRVVVQWLISLVRKDGPECTVANIGLEPKPIQQASFKVGDRVEVLDMSSGLRGCWFRCKVLRVSEKCLKVEYVDVENAERPGKLQEWVSASRVATPILDKLGMRYSGRLTIRPCPPKEEPSSFPLEVGTAVDAWWHDAWWEGVVLNGENNLHVYFPGEGRLMTVQRNNTRISRDWVDKRWVDIVPKPDIVHLISSSLRPNVKLPKSSSVVENSQKSS